VDVSQDVIIREIDCGTAEHSGASYDRWRVLIPVGSRLLGRVVATDVVHPQDPVVLIAHPTTDDAAIAPESWCRRSIGAIAIGVQAALSVCQHCYG